MTKSRQFPDFEMRVAAGKTYGARPFFKFGENLDIDTGTDPEDIHALGGAKLFPTAASTLSVVSTDAADDSVGTGIQTLKILGLDADYNEIEEDVIMDGLTPVVTTLTFLRVFRIHGITGGSNETAVGDIIVTHSEGDICSLPLGHGQSLDCSYTVPAGHQLLLNKFGAAIERTQAGAGAEVHFNIMSEGSNVWRSQALASVVAQGSSSVERNAGIWFPIEEKTDMKITVHTVTVNNTSVSGYFDGILINLALFAW